MKIVSDILEAYEELGYTREEAKDEIRERLEEAKTHLSPSEYREELEFLGTPLSCTVEPTSGTVNTTFTIIVSGHDPRKPTTAYVKRGLTRYRDPVLCTIERGMDRCTVMGNKILSGLMLPRIGPSAKASIYVAQKGWVFSKRSNLVTVTISQAVPIVGGMAAGIPGMPAGVTFADLAPLMPPFPPIPTFVGRMLGLVK